MPGLSLDLTVDRPVNEPRMISDFRMIHPGLGGHHPRKQDDGDFFHRYFVLEAKFLKYHPAIIL